MKAWISLLVWPSIVLLPLVLTRDETYKRVFPSSWYDESPQEHSFFEITKGGNWPKPLGLSLGLLAVVIGQFLMLAYFLIRRAGYLGTLQAVQRDGARPYVLSEGLITHLAQPEGFVMLGGYLIFIWMFGLMPASYYAFAGGINWGHVAIQLMCVDCIQYIMHQLGSSCKIKKIYSNYPPIFRISLIFFFSFSLFSFYLDPLPYPSLPFPSHVPNEPCLHACLPACLTINLCSPNI